MPPKKKSAAAGGGGGGRESTIDADLSALGLPSLEALQQRLQDARERRQIGGAEKGHGAAEGAAAHPDGVPDAERDGRNSTRARRGDEETKSPRGRGGVAPTEEDVAPGSRDHVKAARGAQKQADEGTAAANGDGAAKHESNDQDVSGGGGGGKKRKPDSEEGGVAGARGDTGGGENKRRRKDGAEQVASGSGKDAYQVREYPLAAVRAWVRLECATLTQTSLSWPLLLRR